VHQHRHQRLQSRSLLCHVAVTIETGDARKLAESHDDAVALSLAEVARFNTPHDHHFAHKARTSALFRIASMDLDRHPHRGLWDTCLTKGFDVWNKRARTKSEAIDPRRSDSNERLAEGSNVRETQGYIADFTDCVGCKLFGDDATYCLVKVREAAGACAAASCLEFDTDVQRTCLTVADFDGLKPNACSACKDFTTPELQRYCLFVSDHDCTEADCELMPGKEDFEEKEESRKVDRRKIPKSDFEPHDYRRLHGGAHSVEEDEDDVLVVRKSSSHDFTVNEPSWWLASPLGDQPYHMCRQRIWDTSIIIPQEVATPNTCEVSIDLSKITSPTEPGETNQATVPGHSVCGRTQSGQDIFFHDVGPGATIRIANIADKSLARQSFDSLHALRWGGDCPGDNSYSYDVGDGCMDDSQTEDMVWTNTVSTKEHQVQRAYFTIEHYLTRTPEPTHGFRSDAFYKDKKEIFEVGKYQIAWTLECAFGYGGKHCATLMPCVFRGALGCITVDGAKNRDSIECMGNEVVGGVTGKCYCY